MHQVKPMCAPRSLLQSTSLLGTRWSNATWRVAASATHITWRAAASATPITNALATAATVGDVTIEHVRDEDNPSDFLTKWLPAKIFRLSMEYATSARNATR